MKSLRLFKNHTKKGVASIYVVVFATILFGVVTLSFTRIILSEASQSSNDDLSRSAYDAALAGVEDAKLIVNKYYECLQTPGAACDDYNVFGDDNCEDGFALAEKLYGVDGEVFIQESSNSTDKDNPAADQAYTCVLVSDITPDYRGTLTSDTRTKVIPIQIVGSGATTIADSGKKLGRITFSWYSDLNQGANASTHNFKTTNGSASFPNANDKTIPPTIQLTLIKTPKNIDLNSFHSENNEGGVVYSTMVFLPSGEDSNTPELTLTPEEIRDAGNASTGSTTSTNAPFTLACTHSREFACVVNLDVNGIVATDGNLLLIASLPYGDAYTDFAVSLSSEKDDKDNRSPISFKGAQISVDSTGRTSNLFRRVETRLDPADLFFPYPQFALESGGTGSDDSIKKNFWVTANCWTERGTCPNNNGDSF